jgi:hypothetical protein
MIRLQANTSDHQLNCFHVQTQITWKKPECDLSGGTLTFPHSAIISSCTFCPYVSNSNAAHLAVGCSNMRAFNQVVGLTRVRCTSPRVQKLPSLWGQTQLSAQVLHWVPSSISCLALPGPTRSSSRPRGRVLVTTYRSGYPLFRLCAFGRAHGHRRVEHTGKVLF